MTTNQIQAGERTQKEIIDAIMAKNPTWNRNTVEYQFSDARKAGYFGDDYGVAKQISRDAASKRLERLARAEKRAASAGNFQVRYLNTCQNNPLESKHRSREAAEKACDRLNRAISGDGYSHSYIAEELDAAGDVIATYNPTSGWESVNE